MKLDPQKHNQSDKIHTGRDGCTAESLTEVILGVFNFMVLFLSGATRKVEFQANILRSALE